MSDTIKEAIKNMERIENSEDTKYPEHKKLKDISETSNEIGRFLEWLQDEKEIIFSKSINCLISEYFNIDLNKLEKEKLDMLNEIRENNK